MTTVAASTETMCADTLCIDNESKSYVRKLCRVHRDIIGYCGQVTKGLMFREWYRNGGDKPELGDNFEAVVLTAKGKIIAYDSDLVPCTMDQPFYAIGTGRDAALSALYLGHSPKRAVEIAMLVDHCTGGKVNTMNRRRNKHYDKK